MVGISITKRLLPLVIVEEGMISNNKRLLSAGMLTEETKLSTLNLGP